jgi:hypothetical protein
LDLVVDPGVLGVAIISELIKLQGVVSLVPLQATRLVYMKSLKPIPYKARPIL